MAPRCGRGGAQRRRSWFANGRGELSPPIVRLWAAQPRSGSMLVFVHVSSMNTRRLGSIPLWRFVHWARRLATSGRSRSLATTVFFEAELLSVHEVPHGSIIDLKPARGEFGHQGAQGEGAVPDAPGQKDGVLAGDRLGFAPA